MAAYQAAEVDSADAGAVVGTDHYLFLPALDGLGDDLYRLQFGDLLFGNEWTAAGIAKTSVSLLLLVVVNKTVKKLSATGIF